MFDIVFVVVVAADAAVVVPEPFVPLPLPLPPPRLGECILLVVKEESDWCPTLTELL